MGEITKFYNDKKVLVTGGAGFIGSHIVEKLVAYGAHVTVLDNFSTGNINNLKDVFPYITILYGDITDPFTCMNATQHKSVVFHLAALISVAYSTEHPETCHQINTQGTKNLLKACKKNKVDTFVLSSSAAVYGNRTDRCKETDNPNPASPYAQSKLEGETLCKHFAKKHGINTVSLRYFNVYGDRQDPNGEYAAVVAKFKHNLLNNLPITIFGDGKQTRDFLHVSQVVKSNLEIATYNNLHGDVFNIATGKSITLFELIEQLEKEIQVKRRDVIFKNPRPGDIQTSLASCEKFKQFIFKS